MKIRDVMHPEVLTIEADGTLAQALQRMLWLEVRHLPVLQQGRLVGIVSERDLLRSRGGLAGEKLLVTQAMSSPVRVAHPDEETTDAIERMIVERVGCLPVLDGREMVGIVTRTDLLAWQYRESLQPQTPAPLTVGDVMTPQPAALSPHDTLYLGLSVMMNAGVRHVPVVDEARHVVGILSDRDVRAAIGDPVALLSGPGAYDQILAAPVQRLMTRPVVTASVNAPLELAAQGLIAHRVGAMPVVDPEQRLVGIVSYVDLLRHLAGEQ